jgi:alpha-galactosidase
VGDISRDSQESATIHAREGAWVIETRSSAYALGLDGEGRLVHRYWGPRLPRLEDYPPPAVPAGWASFNGPGQLALEEYPAHAGAKYVEPCLKASFADGVRDVVLAFQGAEVAAGELRLRLSDAKGLRVTLHYRAHAALDLIERWATLVNDGEQVVTLERAFSATWHAPHGEDYRLTHLGGRWLDEFHVRREALGPGVKVLESRRLTTSHHHNPWFALDNGNAGEDEGFVWFGALAWSGNWKLAAERTDFGSTRVSIGLNDWDFAWRLEPGVPFVTPVSYGGLSPEGFGGASRRLHDLVRDELVPHGAEPRPALYNSWEATFFDVDEAGQLELARIAAAMGVELFVMDDGWFHRRDTDNAGLGDWWPDGRKFPRGLGPLIEGVKALGMRFGLWVEPEMVNPDSDLYRAHPEWVIHFPGRERTLLRDQMILNLGREDVQDYLLTTLDRLLGEHEISFIKWDMNRNVSEPGWPDAPGDQREIWVRYVQGLYRVWGELGARHPSVTWQSCSGGGGRADLAVLRLADQVWASDNTDAAARLAIQEGFSLAFPAATMEAWVTDTNAARLPLEFRFHVAMCGVLGVGGNLTRWSAAEREEAARLVALYKEVREVVQRGDHYRLRSPQQHAYSALQYVSKDRDEAVLFAFRTHLPPPVTTPRLRLRGLDPSRLYEVEGLPGARSGAAWMYDGLSIDLDDFSSAVRRVRVLA